MYDEMTGMELPDPKPEFLVLGDDGFAYSIHDSAAAAVAKIMWVWGRKYPEKEFFVEEI